MLDELVRGKTNLYIAGAGRYGHMVARYFEKKHIEYVNAVDKVKKDFCGKETITYDELDIEGFYVVSSLNYEYGDEIKSELILRHVRESNIVSIDDENIIKELFDVVYDYTNVFSPEILKMKDIHKGETCYIVGNGPSVKMSDYDKLVGKHTFGCNCIYEVFPHTKWRPEYYVITDSKFTNDVVYRDIEKIASSRKIITSINSNMLDLADEYSNILYMRMYNKRDVNGFPFFSEKCEDIVFVSESVSYAMLQIAVYMGFETIILIGMDCTSQYEILEDGTMVVDNSVINYNEYVGAIENEHISRGSHIYQMIRGFESAKVCAEKRGINIYNATRGGRLDVYKRIDFDELTR